MIICSATKNKNTTKEKHSALSVNEKKIGHFFNRVYGVCSVLTHLMNSQDHFFHCSAQVVSIVSGGVDVKVLCAFYCFAIHMYIQFYNFISYIYTESR